MMTFSMLSGVVTSQRIVKRRAAARVTRARRRGELGPVARSSRQRATVRRSWKYAIAPGIVGSQKANSAVGRAPPTARPNVDAERRERADHAAVDAADPARQRQQVAEQADEVAP